MTYGQQVAWCARVVENPAAAREVLTAVKGFVEDFDADYEANKPQSAQAQQIYDTMISSYVLEFGYDKRSGQ